MENIKLFNTLKEDTQQYIKKAFSYIEYLYQKEEFIKKDYSIISLGFFLATLSYDNEEKIFLNENDINLDTCLDYLNCKNYTPNNNDISTNKYFMTFSLKEALQEIVDSIKEDYYMEETNFSIKDLEPYQIFDHLIYMYYEPIEELLHNEFGIEDIFNSKVFNDLDRILGNKLYNLAESYGIDIESKIETEAMESTSYGKIDVIWYGNNLTFMLLEKPELLLNDINNKLFRLPKVSKITKINNEPVNESVINKFLLNFDKTNSWTFETLIDNENITFKTTKKDFFEIEEIKSQKRTPALDKYGKDLTSEIYIKDPSIGRDSELRKIMKVLLYPEKDKSIIITGDAGCGKTAIIKGLAYRIQNGNVPNALKNLKIISIDTASLVAGTKYVGTLEEKMKSILTEAEKDKNIILFIDEIHQAISGGKAEGNDNTVAEILKPYLDYGAVRVIGATTTDEYLEYVEPNTAFKTRLKRISVKEPSEDVIYMIIDDLINTYNQISDVKFGFGPEDRNAIINWLIESTRSNSRVYNDKASNPRLILDIVKEFYAGAALDNEEEITVDDIIDALNNEERIYASAKERQIQKLKNILPAPKRECKILEFKPRAY